MNEYRKEKHSGHRYRSVHNNKNNNSNNNTTIILTMAEETKDRQAEEGKDDEVPRAPVEIVKNLSLDILHLAKTSQMKNGLRHQDYRRYRQYCTRRLRRIRKNNQVRFMYANPKGRQYEFHEVRPEDVKDERFIIIPLMMAERAWSYAMQLKQDNENDDFPRKYFHMKRRLTKAARWSTTLKDLCATVGDARTALEAEAYEAWMHANLTLENENWSGAVEKYMHAREVYEQLSQVGSKEERELFRERIEEDIDPSMELCKYNIEMEHGSEVSAELLLKIRLNNKGSQLLRDKLDAALAETRKKQSSQLTSIKWAGSEVELKNAKVREILLKVDDAVYALNQIKEVNTPQKENLFLEVFNVYDEAGRVVREEIAKAKKKGTQKSETLTNNLNIIAAYVKYHKSEMQVRRRVLFVDDLAGKLDMLERGKEIVETEGETTSAGNIGPLELLNGFTMLSREIDSMSNVPGVDRDDSIKAFVDSIGLGCKAFCAYYAGDVYLNQGRYVEANALYGKAYSISEQAIDLHKERASNFTDITTQQSSSNNLKKLNNLLSKLVGRQALVKAKAFLFKTSGGGDNTNNVNTNKTLIERQGEFNGGTVENNHSLTKFPPELKAIAVKPQFFDTAFKCLTFPDLTPVGTKKNAANNNNNNSKDGGKEKNEGGYFSGWFS